VGRSSQGVAEESDSESSNKSFASVSVLKVITEENESNVCVFCKSYAVDEIRLGPLYYHDGVVTHYYCMVGILSARTRSYYLLFSDLIAFPVKFS
jgi:hypothetical protein